MICPNCGKPLKDKAKFCPKCGTKITVSTGATEVAEPGQPRVPAPSFTIANASKTTENLVVEKVLPAEPLKMPRDEPPKTKKNFKGAFCVSLTIVIAVAVILFWDYFKGPTMVDPRDGKTYKVVEIGEQIWMAENLNYKTDKSKCYEYKDENCNKYGRLYVWEDAQGACPAGWHLPSKEEFEKLQTFAGQNAGDIDKAGTVLKSTTGWNEYKGESGNGLDGLGFGALPAGDYYGNGGSYGREGDYAGFWSSTEYNSNRAYRLGLDYDDEYASVDYYTKGNGFSVRCVKNSNEEREASLARPSEAGAATADSTKTLKDSRDGKTYKTVEIGEQIWMAENLNYKTDKSKCYEYKDENCNKYGRLYVWEDAQGACPAGWHLPSKEEFEKLKAIADRISRGRAGTALKSVTDWKDYGNGTDTLGFGALPAGFYGSDGDGFGSEGGYAYFWSSTENVSSSAYYLGLAYLNEGAYLDDYGKDYGFSVRCVKNSNEEREASLARPSEAGAATADSTKTLNDSRDGKTYKTVKIGDQTWMAENLNYRTSESTCYGNSRKKCDKYGRLYNWDEARKACPRGWHLPSKRELEKLLESVGGAETAGEILKSRNGWNGDGNGSDKFGFGALPAGNYDEDEEVFNREGGRTYFWSSTALDEDNAYNLYLGYDRESAGVSHYVKSSGFSVRCVENSN